MEIHPNEVKTVLKEINNPPPPAVEIDLDALDKEFVESEDHDMEEDLTNALALLSQVRVLFGDLIIGKENQAYVRRMATHLDEQIEDFLDQWEDE